MADCLAPFDIDANGTVVGEGGSGLLVTTLDFALRNFLDITSIIVGWGQSGEAGGKAHFAGVGFGGENALIHALELAYRGHGYGVADFQYLVAHATGTRTNSKTDLTTAASARARRGGTAGSTGELPPMPVGTPKAVGDGHTMGETGLKAVSQAMQYLLGKPAVGVPTLRHPRPGSRDRSPNRSCCSRARSPAISTAARYARRRASAVTTVPLRCVPRTPMRSPLLTRQECARGLSGTLAAVAPRTRAA